MLMAVKKAKEASFKKMDSAFATSQSAIQKVKNTDPLNGNEEQEQGNENVSIDPAHYLSKKEKKRMEKAVLYRKAALYQAGRTAVKTAEKTERDCKDRTQFRPGKRKAGGKNLFKGKKISIKYMERTC